MIDVNIKKKIRPFSTANFFCPNKGRNLCTEIAGYILAARLSSL